jgi:hypothetical protein
MLVRKLGTVLAAVMWMAVALTVPGWAQESLKGEWQAKFESRADSEDAWVQESNDR